MDGFTYSPPTHSGGATSERFLPAQVQPVRAIGCNQCWYSPFTGGMDQYVWVGY